MKYHNYFSAVMLLVRPRICLPTPSVKQLGVRKCNWNGK